MNAILVAQAIDPIVRAQSTVNFWIGVAAAVGAITINSALFWGRFKALELAMLSTRDELSKLGKHQDEHSRKMEDQAKDIHNIAISVASLAAVQATIKEETKELRERVSGGWRPRDREG